MKFNHDSLKNFIQFTDHIIIQVAIPITRLKSSLKFRVGSFSVNIIIIRSAWQLGLT